MLLKQAKCFVFHKLIHHEVGFDDVNPKEADFRITRFPRQNAKQRCGSSTTGGVLYCGKTFVVDRAEGGCIELDGSQGRRLSIWLRSERTA